MDKMSANIGINSESILNDTITTCDHRNGSHEPEDNIDAIIIRGNNLNETYGREETNTGHHLSHNNDNNTPEEPLLDTTSTGDETQLTPHMKDRFRRRLRYYFMSPIDKWRSKRRLPFKLVVQVVKIICVTTQLLIYGYDMSGHLAQESNSMIAFRELLLANWDPVREVMAYPPSAGPYALYTRQDFYDGIDYAVRQFSNISESSIGSFGYAVDRSPTNASNMSDVVVQRRHYRTGSAHPSDYRYEYDNEEVSDWVTIGELYPPGDERWFTQFSSQRYFDGHNFTINFDRLLWLEVVFPLRTIYVNSLAKYNAPKCYDLNVTIAYDNTEHDGQMPVHLTVTQRRHRCDGNLADNSDDESERQRRLAINWAVIVLSAVSAVLCLRSLYSGLVLCAESRQFFAHHFQQRLSFGDQMSFCDLWIVLIVINDALITTGTALKMRLEVEFDDSIQYNTVSILLGVGNLCVWTGFLRYLGFAHKYNVLILTLRRAIPNVLRFMLCALILYGGFCLCGWLVLGPYHLKFRTLSLSSECLFSLMNGDDMFATFYVTDWRRQTIIWWFSRLYLYLFVCLFIYVVLSLFIALIMDSYETIKDYYQNGLPLTPLQKLMAECSDESSSAAYLLDRQRSIADTFNECFGCLNGHNR